MRKKTLLIWSAAGLLALGMAANPTAVPAQLAAGSAFSHQGSLTDSGAPADGSYDFQFRLFRQAVGGTPVGTSSTADAVTVTDGLYSVAVDFGSAPFADGEPAFLEIAVRATGSGPNYTILSPRHELTPTPYALVAGHALTAESANSAQTADSATTADTATSAQSADTATTADSASTASEADVAFGLDAERVKSDETSDDGGRLRVLGANDDSNVELTNSPDGSNRANRGRVSLHNPDGDIRSVSEVLPSGAGAAELWGTNGSLNVALTATSQNDNRGIVSVADENGIVRGELLVSRLNNSAGWLTLYGPNGNINVALEDFNENINGGWMSVNDSTGQNRAGLYVNSSNQGVMFADVKNFVVEHPVRPGERIIYSSLEGPEIGIYTRGVAKLERGQARIELPEHFTALARDGSVTVQLTPASTDSRGVAVQRASTSEFWIAELGGGEGSYEVHYLVQAERIGFDDYRPVISESDFRRQYGQGDAVERRGAGGGQAISSGTGGQ